MKGIITGLLLILGFVAFGQKAPVTPTLNPMTFPNRGAAGSLQTRSGSVTTFFFPSSCGVPVLSMNNIGLGALAFDSCNKVLYAFDPKDSTWNAAGGGISPTDTANKWVNRISKNATGDSIIYYIGSTRYAVKDSIGTGALVGVADTLDFDPMLPVTTITPQRHEITIDTTRGNRMVAPYYYVDSLVAAGGGGGSGWSLTGNAGTIAGTNFVGTTDAIDLVFKRNSTEAGRIRASGTSLGVGSNSTGTNNTALGANALGSNATGVANTAIGSGALFGSTNDNNVAIGKDALFNLQTGSNNIAIGANIMTTSPANTSANIAIGNNALQINTTGDSNTVIGTGAFITNTTGKRNTALGYGAVGATATTRSSIAIGFYATPISNQLFISDSTFYMHFKNLDSATGSAPNIVGIDDQGNWHRYAGGGTSLPSTPNRGLFIDGNGVPNVSDSLIVDQAAGTLSSLYNINSEGNLLLSNNGLALYDGSVATGAATGYIYYDGTANIIEGDAGKNFAFQNTNVGIGTTTPTVPFESHGNTEMQLGYHNFSDVNGFSTMFLLGDISAAGEMVWGDVDGNTTDTKIGVNPFASTVRIKAPTSITFTTPLADFSTATVNTGALNTDAGSGANAILSTGTTTAGDGNGDTYIKISGSVSDNKIDYFSNTTHTFQTGTVTIADLSGTGTRAVLADASGVLSAPISDSSTKFNIKKLTGGLSTLNKLKPVTFEYKAGFQNYGKGQQIGFIAQDIQQVLPNSVYTNTAGKTKGKMGYNETDIIPVLVKAVQELSAKVDAQAKEIKKLKRKN